MNILIGSQAIKNLYPDFPREPKDIDYVGNQMVIPFDNKRVEYHRNPIILEIGKPLSGDQLLTLKVSHIFWDLKWEKHMFDIQFLLKKGCIVHKPLLNRLYDYWETIHGKNNRSNLSQTSKDFFNNAIKCDLEHDFIHKLINPTPLYTKILSGEVETSEEKWNSLSHEDKIELIREEVYVMSYERLGNKHYRQAYTWQIKQMILRHLPMYSALFAVENYIELHLPKINYKNKIEHELSRI